MYEKLTTCPNFTRFLPEKLSKYPNFLWHLPEFYMIFFARKMTEFYIIIDRKIFSRFFFFLGGARALPAPVSYAYVPSRARSAPQGECPLPPPKTNSWLCPWANSVLVALSPTEWQHAGVDIIRRQIPQCWPAAAAEADTSMSRRGTQWCWRRDGVLSVAGLAWRQRTWLTRTRLRPESRTSSAERCVETGSVLHSHKRMFTYCTQWRIYKYEGGGTFYGVYFQKCSNFNKILFTLKIKTKKNFHLQGGSKGSP